MSNIQLMILTQLISNQSFLLNELAVLNPGIASECASRIEKMRQLVGNVKGDLSDEEFVKLMQRCLV